MPMSDSIWRHTFSRLSSERGQSSLSLLLAHVSGLGVNLSLLLLLAALFYLPMVISPRTVGNLLAVGTDGRGLVFLLTFGVLIGSWLLLLWQGILSATFARRDFAPEKPALSRLPVFRLMLLSFALALPPSLLSLLPAFGIKDNPELSLMLTGGLLVLLLPLLGNVMLLKSQALALGHENLLSQGSLARLQAPDQRPIARKLYGINLLFVLSCLILAGLEAGIEADETLATFAPVAGFVSLLLWLGLSLLLGLIAVRAYRLLQPQTTAELPTGRPFIWGLAALAGSSLLLIGGLYGYQQSELARLDQDWQTHFKTQQARVNLKRPVLRGQPLAGNGAPHYWSVVGKDAKGSFFEMTEPDRTNISQYYEALTHAKPAGTLNWLPAAEQRYAKPVAKVRQATQYERIDFKPSFKIEELLPNYINAQDLAKLMTLEAVSECRRGACDQGMRRLLDTLRLGQDIGGHGWLISTMVGMVVEQNTLQGFGAHFEPDWLTPAQYRQTLSEFSRLLQQRPSYIYPLLNETGMMMQLSLETAKSGAKSMEMISIFGNETEPEPLGPSAWIGYMSMLPQFLDAYRLSRELEQEWQKLENLPFHELKARLDANQAELEARMAQNVLTGIGMPNYTGATDRIALGEARLNGFYQYLALQAYYREHGKYPESLQALVPSLLPKLPADPFTGKAFVYQRLSDKDFRLSSPGKDLKSESSKAVFYHKSCQADDIVFAAGKHKAYCQY